MPEIGKIIFVVGVAAALAACDARDLEAAPWRVLHDVRGDRSAEVAAHGGEYPAHQVAELEREACRRSDAHVAVSGLLAELVSARGARGETEVFPCAADTARFRPDPAARASRRAEIDAAAGDFVLGFVGSTAGWQRPDALLRLFRLVRDRRPEARLLVLTPGVEAFTELLSAELSRRSKSSRKL